MPSSIFHDKKVEITRVQISGAGTECPKNYEESSVNSLLIIRVVIPSFKRHNKVTSAKVCNRYKRLICYSAKFYIYIL